MSRQGQSAIEKAASAAIAAIDRVQLTDAGASPVAGPPRTPLQRTMSSIERRAAQLKTLDDLVKFANLDSPAPAMERTLFKSRSMQYGRSAGSLSFGRASAPGNDPMASGRGPLQKNSRSLSMGHYGRAPSYSVDGTGVGYLASQRVMSLSLASESVREEAGEGEDVDTPASANTSLLSSSPASALLQEEGLLSLIVDTVPTSRLRTSTTPTTPPPGIKPDGEEDIQEGEEGAEGAGAPSGERTPSRASGSGQDEGGYGRTDSDPLGMGYAEGEGSGGEEERTSRNSKGSRTNPWAPLPGPCIGAVQPIHVQRMQEAARGLATFDSLRVRARSSNDEPLVAPFKLGVSVDAP